MLSRLAAGNSASGRARLNGTTPDNGLFDGVLTLSLFIPDPDSRISMGYLNLS